MNKPWQTVRPGEALPAQPASALLKNEQIWHPFRMPERGSVSRSGSAAKQTFGLGNNLSSSDAAAGQRPALQFAFDGAIPVGNPLRARLSLTFVVGLLSLGLTGCFKVSSDVGALRDSVLKAAPAEREERFEIGVGPLTLNLARA